ncbi:UNVERIFIED_CONTAM: hypothetical protein PYX00_000601 [Menopon gallinae]|uniref:Nucleoporin NSP1-like C-terminal domain-containing protein n=1 Tax=Menopon gallinae TaxID=328185 RepID=A0AAW2I9Q1_9NEOP
MPNEGFSEDDKDKREEGCTRGEKPAEKAVFFHLTKFDSEVISHQEQLPKTFNDFEALLNKILINLEETEYVFRNQAKEILDRDLTLLNWRTKLKKLEEYLEEKRQGHERIDQRMQFVSKLGVQINNTLLDIEKEIVASTQMTNGRRYTPERMSMYDGMLNLNVGLKEMLQQVSDTVLSINDLIECNPSDPIEQFTRILSLHMETLRIIERKIVQTEEEVRTVQSLQEFYSNLKTPTVYEYYH